tara:strand:+ start:789 stop:983 length:195 start_codon:yes stop_codon:yes gene_type:complete
VHPPEEEFRVGDLVIYKFPRKFFTAENVDKNVIGVVTKIDSFHVKVFWADEHWCLESLEDLSAL